MKTQSPALAQSAQDSQIVPLPPAFSRSGLRRFSKGCREKIQQLKESILAEMSFRFSGKLSPEVIRLAVNEADALASSTPFPALFLPALAEEKLHFAERWHSKQQQIGAASWNIAA
jgi:hypothetical protein